MSAFEARAIAVDRFTEPATLLSAWEVKGFDAILVQDRRALLRDWLEPLQAQVASRTPVIVVGIGDAHSIAQALMWGADDYATEAEGPAGLFRRTLARVRAGAMVERQPPLRVGSYSLHTRQRIVASPSHQVRLTARECNLARVLFEHAEQLVATEVLSAVVHGPERAGSKRSVEQHVYKLRRKCALVSVEQDTPLRIESVYATGYRLQG
jgi:DNA-binding response OmpR family regulator